MSKPYRVYALVVLFWANFLNYMDRFVVAVLEGALESKLHIDSVQFGYTVSAFTVGYILTAPFIGFFADRSNRPRLLAICVLIWSTATIQSGQTTTFHGLLAMRLLTGVGEAGCLIIGPSLVADTFSRARRGQMLALFYLGMPLGGAAGLIVGGVGGSLEMIFWIAGAPGLVVTALILLLRDPPRGAGDVPEAQAHTIDLSVFTMKGFRAYAELFRNRTLVLIMLAQAFAIFVFAPTINFGPRYFETVKGISLAKVSVTFGVVAAIAGIGGSYLSGLIGDMRARRHPGSYAAVAAFCFLLGTPLIMIGIHATHPTLYLVGMLLGFTLFFACMPALNTQIANVVSPHKRAMAFAVTVFVLHLLGDTISPPLFGFVKQNTSTETAFWIFPPVLLLSALACWLASRSAPRDVKTLDSQDPTQTPV